MQHFLINKKNKLETINYAFAVVCKSLGNPVYLQNELESVSPENMFSSNTLDEASKICREYILNFNLGGGNWAGGQVYHPKKGLIANISFNGKVWKLNNTKYPNEDLKKQWNQLELNNIID